MSFGCLGCLYMTAANPPFLELVNVTACQQQNRVFHELSLRIEMGERVAILGPNGAGKSTLLKLISREIYPLVKKGSYLKLFGRERFSLWDIRAEMGFVSLDLQDDYSPHTEALDVVVSGFFGAVGTHQHLVVSNEQREKGRLLLEQVGMSAFARQQYQRLSTGQKRRLLLARALVHEPQTLILDEPSTGLDMGGSAQLLSYLRAFAAQERAMIITTHHIEEIIPEIDRVILLKQGEVMADGAKQEVLTSGNLGELYGMKLEVDERGGWYRCWY